MALSESLTKAIFRVTVPPLPRFNSITSTRVPAFSPSAEAMPEDVVAAAGGAAGGVDDVAEADEVVTADEVVSGAGAAACVVVVASFFAQDRTAATESRRTR